MFIPVPTFKPRDPSEILAQAAESPNAFNSWFGAVQACNVLTPATLAVDLLPNIQIELLDGKPLSEESKLFFDGLVEQVQQMGEQYGYPLFIKTSFTSAKHYWSSSCCLKGGDPKEVLSHLYELINFQACCTDQMLSPSLVIREMIETDPVFHAFEGMPVTEEYRVFTKGGEIEGFQPYWPEDSIQNPSCEDWQEKLKTIKSPSQADIAYMSDVASRVSSHLKREDWSIDFLRAKDGRLWLIDMAVAGKSYRNVSEFQAIDVKKTRLMEADNSPTV